MKNKKCSVYKVGDVLQDNFKYAPGSNDNVLWLVLEGPKYINGALKYKMLFQDEYESETIWWSSSYLELDTLLMENVSVAAFRVLFGEVNNNTKLSESTR